MTKIEIKPTTNSYFKAYVCASHSLFLDRSNFDGRWKKIETVKKKIEDYRNNWLPGDIIDGYIIFKTENRKIVEIVEVYGTVVIYDPILSEMTRDFVSTHSLSVTVY